ncbi:hypothetical protein C0638_20805 [Paenibacillus sp. lzh-N1]|uniref:Uncharacterized protein n=1 Tax=Paenibacillus polymyxa (strain SC2) TaxID=886882 RepID=A0A0D5ZCE5_PAEPS|nr:hypothetical protein PPSC2_12240 [Paenibacillus polymyxa SC2]AUO08805.1 hypothetical protein C0638_20805 [Paenibacillus sp. lzh-N1]
MYNTVAMINSLLVIVEIFQYLMPECRLQASTQQPHVLAQIPRFIVVMISFTTTSKRTILPLPLAGS